MVVSVERFGTVPWAVEKEDEDAEDDSWSDDITPTRKNRKDLKTTQARGDIRDEHEEDEKNEEKRWRKKKPKLLSGYTEKCWSTSNEHWIKMEHKN